MAAAQEFFRRQQGSFGLPQKVSRPTDPARMKEADRVVPVMLQLALTEDQPFFQGQRSSVDAKSGPLKGGLP